MRALVRVVSCVGGVSFAACEETGVFVWGRGGLACACVGLLAAALAPHTATRAHSRTPPRSLPLVCAVGSSSVAALASRGLSDCKCCCTRVLSLCVCLRACVWVLVTCVFCGMRSAVSCLRWAVWALVLAWCWHVVCLCASCFACVRGRSACVAAGVAVACSCACCVVRGWCVFRRL